MCARAAERVFDASDEFCQFGVAAIGQIRGHRLRLMHVSNERRPLPRRAGALRGERGRTAAHIKRIRRCKTGRLRMPFTLAQSRDDALQRGVGSGAAQLEWQRYAGITAFRHTLPPTPRNKKPARVARAKKEIHVGTGHHDREKFLPKWAISVIPTTVGCKAAVTTRALPSSPCIAMASTLAGLTSIARGLGTVGARVRAGKKRIH